jgi:hypothetical protein
MDFIRIFSSPHVEEEEEEKKENHQARALGFARPHSRPRPSSADEVLHTRGGGEEGKRSTGCVVDVVA